MTQSEQYELDVQAAIARQQAYDPKKLTELLDNINNVEGQHE